jgi:hypothetical protein
MISPAGLKVRQILGHKSLHHTVSAYAGVDSRRAGRHHQHLIEEALSAQSPSRPRGFRANRVRWIKKAKVMSSRRKLMPPFTHWPIEDRRRWEAAFQSGDLFDENGAGTRLAVATRQAGELWEVFGISVGQAPEAHNSSTGRTDRSANGGQICSTSSKAMRRHIVSCRSPQLLQHAGVTLPQHRLVLAQVHRQ